MEWWLIDRLAQVLVLLILLLLDWGVKSFWPVVGFPMLYFVSGLSLSMLPGHSFTYQKMHEMCVDLRALDCPEVSLCG